MGREAGLALLLVGDTKALRLMAAVRGRPGLPPASVGDRLRAVPVLGLCRMAIPVRGRMAVPVRGACLGLQRRDRRLAQLRDAGLDHLRGHVLRYPEIERFGELSLPRRELERDTAPVARLRREAG